MATGAVMPVNCICLVESNSLGKVLDCFFVFEKTVPNQTTPVVTRCVVSICRKHLVEVLKGHCESIASDFFANGAEVVHGLDVGWLKTNCK
jgi:hypothetical protein